MDVKSVTLNSNTYADSDSDESVYSTVNEQGDNSILKKRGLLNREMNQQKVQDVMNKDELDDLVSCVDDDDDYRREILGSTNDSASSKRQKNKGGGRRRRRY